MRGFEQVASKPRCDLTQFHRLVKLKLVTVGKIAQSAIIAGFALTAALPDVGIFYLIFHAA